MGNSYGLLNGGNAEKVGSKKKRRPRKAVAEPPEPVSSLPRWPPDRLTAACRAPRRDETLVGTAVLAHTD